MKIKLLFGLSFIIIMIILSLLYINWISAPDFWEIAKKQTTTTLEVHSQISRNRGWLTWMVISLSGLAIGMGLTTWGRIIQHKSHLHERLEKAASMLGSQTMGMRIAGCRALIILGKEDKSMKSLCVSLLFAFINNPYLKEKDEDKDPNDLFSDAEKPLRADIQEAVNSFSTIYNHYGDKEIDDKLADLPTYFWKNKVKNKIFLIKAYLKEAKLEEAYLPYANLQEANLSEAELTKADLGHARLQRANLYRANLQEANLTFARLENANLSIVQLQEANLEFANLQGVSFKFSNFEGVNLRGANITNVIMERVRKLTKEQILSARWGVYGKIETERPPSLPYKFKNDPEVQEWLETPYYIKRKEEREKYLQQMKKREKKLIKKGKKD